MHPKSLDRELEELKDMVPVKWQHAMGLMSWILDKDRDDVLEGPLCALSRKVKLSSYKNRGECLL